MIIYALNMASVTFRIALMLVGCTLAEAQGDPLIGTWEKNVSKSTEQSRIKPARPDRGGWLILEAKPDGVQSTNITIDADGKERKIVDMLYFDGKPYPRPGRVDFDAASWSRPNLHTMYRVFFKDSKVVGIAIRWIEKDGRTMYSTTQRTQADGSLEDSVAVWEKSERRAPK